MATISSLLADHVSLRVRSVDRIFLAGYVPRLQSDRLLVRFLNQRAGGTIPSPGLLGKIGRSYVEQVNAFAKAREIPVVRFTKDMVKEDVARRHTQAARILSSVARRSSSTTTTSTSSIGSGGSRL